MASPENGKAESLMTPKELAAYIRCSVGHVYNKAGKPLEEGGIPCERLGPGGSPRFRPKVIDAWLQMYGTPFVPPAKSKRPDREAVPAEATS